MKIIFIACLFIVCTSIQATNGSAFIGVGPKQNGTAGAGVAKPADSTWLTLNPAGLVELESGIDMSLEVFRPRRRIKMKSPAGPFGLANDGFSDTDNTMSYVPQFSMLYRIDEDQAVALGLLNLGGAFAHFEDSRTSVGKAGNFDKNIEWATTKLIAAYAKRLKNGWSLSFAPSIVYSTMRSDIMTANAVQTKGDNDIDDSFGAGFTLGIFKKWQKLSFGASYVSRQWTQQLDQYEDILLRPLDHPQNLQIGIAYAVTEKLDLLVDYKWVDWKSIEQLGKSSTLGGFGWSSQHIFKIAFVWEATDKLILRAGYSYGKSPIGDEDVFANTLFAAPIEHHAACGLTYKVNQSLEIDISYIHGFKNGLREDNKDIGFARGSEVSLSLNSVAIGISWKF